MKPFPEQERSLPLLAQELLLAPGQSSLLASHYSHLQQPRRWQHARLQPLPGQEMLKYFS